MELTHTRFANFTTGWGRSKKNHRLTESELQRSMITDMESMIEETKNNNSGHANFATSPSFVTNPDGSMTATWPYKISA